MSKIKLIVQEGYGSNYRPYISGTQKVIDLDLSVPDTHHILGVVRHDFDKESDGSRRVDDELLPTLPVERVNNLVGKLMTITDASFSDKDQRKAFKDLLMQAVWEWQGGLREIMVEPWRLDKFPNYKKAFEKD